MAVTVRALFPAGTGIAQTSISTTVTQSVTVVAGDVLEAHASCDIGTDTAVNLSATANGVAADGSSIEVHSNGQTAGFSQVFYWLAPASGTYNVVVTATGGTPLTMGLKVRALSGTDNATAPTITTFNFTDTTTRTTLSITTSDVVPAGSLALSHFCAGSSITTTNQTSEYAGGTANQAAGFIAGSSAAGAGSTIQFTGSMAADWYGAITTVWGGPPPTQDEGTKHRPVNMFRMAR